MAASQAENAVNIDGTRKPLTGIALKMTSVAIFVAMSTLIKEAGQLPTGQISFFRSLFALVPLAVIFARRGQLLTAFRTEHRTGHVCRSLFGVTSMWLSFYGLTRLPLPEAITINYAQPLAVVMLSALVVGEVVRVYRWSAVMLGFVGVVTVSWPNLNFLSDSGGSMHTETLGVIAVLGAAALSAVAMLFVRKLVMTEKSVTVTLYFSSIATVLSLLTLPLGWDPLSHKQLMCLIAAGICGGIAQVLLAESYRHADMSTIAPFEYTSMLLAIASGYLVFGEVPTAYTIVGGGIVVSAGLFIIWREQRLGLPRGAARKLVPLQ